MSEKKIQTEEEELAVIRQLEKEGIVSRAPEPGARLKPIAKSPGALKRFLDSRD